MISHKQVLDKNSSFFSNRSRTEFHSDSSTKYEIKSTKYKIKIAIDEFNAREKDNFISQFKRLLDESDFEYGFSSPAEKYVKDALKNFGVFARDWITEIFVQNLDNEYITSSILKVLMHLDYADLEPQGIIILLAALNHKSPVVREDVIRTFENWENPEYIRILKTIKYGEPWLKTMLDEVIEHLESL